LSTLPDNVTAAAMALAVGQSGLASTKTVVLVTPEETDAATKKSVNYRGPGVSVHLTSGEAPSIRCRSGSMIPSHVSPRETICHASHT
jgi:hypothetical protein